jgi:hypothetical protein
MSSNLPAAREEAPLVVDTVHELHPDHHDPQVQEVQQNLAVALIPLALIAFLVISFAAAAWTFLAATPGPGH